MEQALIADIVVERATAKITLTELPDAPDAAARVFGVLAAAGAGVDVGLTTRYPSARPGRADLVFTLPERHGRRLLSALLARRAEIGFARARCDERMATVSLLGAGLRSGPAVIATFCAALATAGVRLDATSVSDARISALCAESRLGAATGALRAAFGLRAAADADATTAADERVHGLCGPWSPGQSLVESAGAPR